MKYVFAYLTHLQVSNFFLLFFVLSNYQTSAENVGKRPNAKISKERCKEWKFYIK